MGMPTLSPGGRYRRCASSGASQVYLASARVAGERVAHDPNRRHGDDVVGARCHLHAAHFSRCRVVKRCVGPIAILDRLFDHRHHEPSCSSTLPENSGSRGRLVDKVATAFASSRTEHGGQESTTLALSNALCKPGAATRCRSGQQDEAIERYRCVRTSRDPGNSLMLCKAWRMSRSLTASRLRPP